MSYDTNDLVNLGHLESVSKVVAKDISGMQSQYQSLNEQIVSLRTRLSVIEGFTGWGDYKVVSFTTTNSISVTSTWSRVVTSSNAGTLSTLGISSADSIVKVQVTPVYTGGGVSLFVSPSVSDDNLLYSISAWGVTSATIPVTVYWTIWYTEE